MSSLTDQERLGLEEVFMSISPKREHPTLMQRIRLSVDHWRKQQQHKNIGKSVFYSLKERIRMPKIGDFAPKNLKKKKFLS